MKVFWALALFAVTATALPLNEAGNRVNGENGWYVPQNDGTFVWMNMNEAENMLDKMEMAEARAISTNPVNFYLYTLSNPTTPQEISANDKSIAASHFNPDLPTIFIIHGWTQSHKDPMNSQIRDAWFSQTKANVIVVDWARARSLEYASSVIAVSKAGEKVGNMVTYLCEKQGLSPTFVTLVGHSLGAHVAGHAGKTFGSGKLYSIVGLDPALPLFSFNSPEKRLSSTDAFYVESIHTNGGTLGFLRPIGRGAFYPNGGQSQPGCGIDLTGSCAHSRSVTYYAEAIRKNNFPSMSCADYQDAVNSNCGNTFSSVRMSSAINPLTVNGEFYVPVNSAAPFGKGS